VAAYFPLVRAVRSPSKPQTPGSPLYHRRLTFKAGGPTFACARVGLEAARQIFAQAVGIGVIDVLTRRLDFAIIKQTTE